MYSSGWALPGHPEESYKRLKAVEYGLVRMGNTGTSRREL